MPSGGDENLRTVVFSSTLSPGAQAGFPVSYQVVVRSNVFNTSALDAKYVTHRVITPARK